MFQAPGICNLLQWSHGSLLSIRFNTSWMLFFWKSWVLSFDTAIRLCNECWGRTTKLGDEPIPVACVESTTRRRMGHRTRSVWDPWRSFKSSVLLCVVVLGYNVIMKQSSTLYWFCCDSWQLHRVLPSQVAPEFKSQLRLHPWSRLLGLQESSQGTRWWTQQTLVSWLLRRGFAYTVNDFATKVCLFLVM